MKIIRRLLLALGLLLAFLMGVAFIAGQTWPAIHDVKTGETAEYPNVQPQSFAHPAYRVYDAALATAQSLGWEIIGEDRNAGEIQAVATVPIVHFKDDVTITVKPDGTHTAVNVRSRSRVGKGDLGVNARRILRFQEELAKRL